MSAPRALAVLGHGTVDPSRPWLRADDDAVLRGRAAFETARVYDGVPFRLDAHLERLEGSARLLALPRFDRAALADLAGQAIAAAGGGDGVLRLVWTPGPDGGSPCGFALVTDLPPGLEERRGRGIAVVSLQLAVGARARMASPWLLAGVKSTSYAVNMAAQQEAGRREGDDAVFLSLEGLLLEGPTSNVWFLRGGRLHTPSLDLPILAGVTRDTLLGAARELGIPANEGEYTLDELAGADEAFLSSSVREVMPIVRIDGKPLATGAPGEVSVELWRAVRRAASGA